METEQLPDKKFVIISVSVPFEMKEYFDKHPKVNRSKLFQDAVNAFRYPRPKKLSPSLVLLCFMGVIGGIVIAILAGLMYQWINQIFAVGLLMLGLALALGSMLTIFRARIDAKREKQKRELDAQSL